ncbi:MAG: hypothetical protein ACFE9L_09855 [Candidatus Hodarchaeota archaeon]
MIGVNITTKNGLLLFSHSFMPGFSDVDEDLRAGLMTAVLNAVKETQNDTGIKTIDQGKYFVHIVEGEFTYGLFFSYENDLKEYKFANATLQQFENEFHIKLKEDVLSYSHSENEFDKFQEYLKKQYSALISIDVAGLSKIIEVMEPSFFSDYIILEKPYLHQVFTTISLPDIHPYANQLALMCKNMHESSIKIGHEIRTLQFNLGENYYVFADQFGKYILIVVISIKERDKALKELNRIHHKLSS